MNESILSKLIGENLSITTVTSSIFSLMRLMPWRRLEQDERAEAFQISYDVIGHLTDPNAILLQKEGMGHAFDLAVNEAFMSNTNVSVEDSKDFEEVRAVFCKEFAKILGNEGKYKSLLPSMTAVARVNYQAAYCIRLLLIIGNGKVRIGEGTRYLTKPYMKVSFLKIGSKKPDGNHEIMAIRELMRYDADNISTRKKT